MHNRIRIRKIFSLCQSAEAVLIGQDVETKGKRMIAVPRPLSPSHISPSLVDVAAPISNYSTVGLSFTSFNEQSSLYGDFVQPTTRESSSSIFSLYYRRLFNKITAFFLVLLSFFKSIRRHKDRLNEEINNDINDFPIKEIYIPKQKDRSRNQSSNSTYESATYTRCRHHGENFTETNNPRIWRKESKLSRNAKMHSHNNCWTIHVKQMRSCVRFRISKVGSPWVAMYLENEEIIESIKALVVDNNCLYCDPPSFRVILLQNGNEKEMIKDPYCSSDDVEASIIVPFMKVLLQKIRSVPGKIV